MADMKGKVIASYLDDKMIFKCKVLTDHGEKYPSMFLLNEDGGVNTKSEEYAKKTFGWDGERTSELKTLAIGKEVILFEKLKNGYTNCYFSDGERKSKDISATDADAKWRNAKCGISNPAPAPAAGGSEDLSIKEENIPF